MFNTITNYFKPQTSNNKPSKSAKCLKHINLNFCLVNLDYILIELTKTVGVIQMKSKMSK